MTKTWHITRDPGDELARAFCAYLAARFRDQPMNGTAHVSFDPVDGVFAHGPGLRVVVSNNLVRDRREEMLDKIEAYFRSMASP